jgi:hypothetical protein
MVRTLLTNLEMLKQVQHDEQLYNPPKLLIAVLKNGLIFNHLPTKTNHLPIRPLFLKKTSNICRKMAYLDK